jgi:hypothetical protein
MNDKEVDPKFLKNPREARGALHEDDPGLERDYRALAQWLIDVYLRKRQQAREDRPQDQIDLTK